MSTDPGIAGQAHTYRITLRQGKGYPGQDAFVKVEVDGVQKFYRNTGDLGRTSQEAYFKLTGLYDYGKRLVDPANKTRNKKFSLVTEAMNIWELNSKRVKTVSD